MGIVLTTEARQQIKVPPLSWWLGRLNSFCNADWPLGKLYFMSGDRRQDAGEWQIGCVTITTSAVRLDDDSTVELNGAAGRTLFDIRARIIKDRAALKGLQEYVSSVCQ